MRFSVTIPAYKSKYLRECIDSILAQTFTDFELVIVNDASPEDLGSIVGSYTDARIRYYVNERNCGAVDVVDNWNKCLEQARGEYIICMGDDDQLLPDALQQYDELITRYPGLAVYHGWTELIDHESRGYDMQLPRPEYESAYALILHHWTNGHQYIGDFVYHTETLRSRGGYVKLPLAWGSDNITAVIAAAQGGTESKGIANTQRMVFQYRVNPLSISSSGDMFVKMDTIGKEREWYVSFLSHPIDNLQDEKIRQKLLTELPLYFQKKYVYCIADSLPHGNSLGKLIHWLRHGKDYGLSTPSVLYAYFIFLKKKIRK